MLRNLWGSFAFTVARNSIFSLIKSPRVCFAIAAGSVVVGAYYALALKAEVPGSAFFRGRWESTTTMRGARGNRDHAPRPAGPIDLSILAGLALVTTWQGLSLLSKNKQQENTT
ncbi:MAG: hypothetical protein ABL962_08465 [Fimbriimonadaceae bacterium]